MTSWIRQVLSSHVALGFVLSTTFGVMPACRRVPPPNVNRPVLRITTAFGPFSIRLIADYRRAIPSLDVQPTRLADSDAVVAAIESGTADLGLAFADSVYSAYSTPGGKDHIRGLSLLEPLPAYILVNGSLSIHTMADLRGRRMAILGQSAKPLGRLLMNAFGVNTADTNLSLKQDIGPAFASGVVDAVMFMGYVYPDKSTQSLIQEGAYFIPVEGPPVDALRQQYPFVRSVIIPRGIYPGQDRIIPTIGVDVVIVCRRDLDESIVYETTKELFIAYPQLSGVEATLRFLNLDDAPATPIPLHPGAARYFRERELSR